MTEQQTIETLTGASQHSCTCQECQKMCKRSPCIGTPDDIRRLINNGYIHKLVLTCWVAGLALGVPAINMVQMEYDEHGCVLFKNGLCSIHDTGLKPTEGKLASHNAKVFRSPADAQKSVAVQVALTWLLPWNQQTVKWVENAVATYIKAKNNGI